MSYRPRPPGPSTRHSAPPLLPATAGGLQLSAAQLHTVLDSITDGLAVLDPQWNIVYLNARAEDLIHARTPERPTPLGKNLWQEFPALRHTVLEERFRHALAGQQTVSFELYYTPRARWLEVRAFPSSEGLTAYIQDITRRKDDERALRDSSKRLQVALSTGQLGDWSGDMHSRTVILGRRAAVLFDLPEETPLPWTALRDRVLREDWDAVWQAFQQARASASDFQTECRVQHGGGERLWLRVAGRFNYGEGGELLGMTGMVQDVSTRKAAEDTLRHSQEELRALANSIPQLAWIAHFDGNMVWYNERWYEYTGTSPEQALNHGWEEVYEPDSLPAMKARWRESLRSGTPFEMEFPIRGADGHYRWFLTRANPVRDSTGQLRCWFGTSTDVDQVKRAQEALREESKMLEVLNSTGNALAQRRELRPLLQDVTAAAADISGARFAAFYYRDEGGAPLYTVAGQAPDAFRRLPLRRAAALLAPVLRGAAILRSADAPDDPALRSYLALPVRSGSSAVLGALFFGHPEPDMFSERTERIVAGFAAQAGVALDNARLNEAMRHAAEERRLLLDSERGARAEAERTSQMKDEFLATLSHELRTPLTAILGWAQVLRRGSRDQADLNRGLETIERNARAQAQLIEDLLDMSRITSGKVQLDMQQISPLTILDAVIETVRPAAEAKHIRIERDYQAKVLVAADPSRLQQVMWNLLSNALKFTPHGGAVQLSVGLVGGLVEIVVSDNGIGIEPAFLAHVFERFRQADASTTRRHGGLGLGLSIVKHLVEQHGGTVAAASAGAGRGASFTVRLPLASGPALPLRPARPPAPPPAAAFALPDRRELGGLRVLVVDDETDARELIQRILGDNQASVTLAASAAEALKLARRQRFDLLLTDIGMPGTDGFELLARIRALGAARGGNLPAIALTAFARSEDRLRVLESGFLDHLAKPVEPAQLLAAVALAARQAGRAAPPALA
ncbi:hybrid sensor histidine kinase/response regulator [Pseudoduganella violacea]|uniref:Virulence sensor protein BvgS n=1 Tax=Pseudoduganella violacea TaxID=1715466 RepID=A0A7W5B7X8_9BURK|nr:PAS domain S-box protein [Pseudoduganella violacea]MBB3118197.1 PAS domain S-box-containing protein [Pseudoduganella violacea]